MTIRKKIFIFITVILGILFLLALIFFVLFQLELKRREKDMMLYPGYDKKIKTLLNSGQTIRLYSSGGLTSYALEIAKIIDEEKKILIIDRVCLSGCAELLMPAADKIIFEDQPIIGFHGNILHDEYVVNMFATKNKNLCGGWLYARETEKLYRRHDLNPEFWKEQIKRLEPDPILTTPKYGCPIVDPVFKNRFWYPTSQQLRELLGLKFEGSVCADDPECFGKILRWQLPGDRIVIGDDVYVSWGLFLKKQKKPRNKVPMATK